MRIVYKSLTGFRTMTASGQIPDTKGCVAITIQNTGTVDLTINGGFVLAPGEVFANSQPHPDMYDVTDYEVFFDDGGGAAVVLTFAKPIDLENNTEMPNGAKCLGY